MESITDRMLVRRAVQGGSVEEAIDRVNDLNPEILEHDSKLFFHLQQQRLIELIRHKEVDKALLFAQEYVPLSTLSLSLNPLPLSVREVNKPEESQETRPNDRKMNRKKKKT